MNRIKLLFLPALLMALQLSAQEKGYAFSYDKSGNVVQRTVKVMGGARLGNFNSAKDSAMVDNLKIYPNPTNQYINLEGELPANVKEASVRLMNLSGQVLKTDVYNGQLKTMPVNDLKEGMYLLELTYSKKNRSTYKIIITN